MTIVAVLVGVVLAWCLLALPLAVAVGRSFRAGEVEVDLPGQDAAAVAVLLS